METVIVAGGDGTIGQAIVKKFYNNGFRTIVLDKCDNSQLKGIEYYKCDLTKYNELLAIQKDLNLKNELTTLIWTAGGSLLEEWTNLNDLNLNILRDTINENLIAPIELSKCFYNDLLRSNSTIKSIILVSSINADRPFRLAGYSASKAGLKGFMMGELREFSTNGIRINIVAPGTVISQKTLQEKNKNWSGLLEKTAFKKFTTPEDIASLVFQLANNKSITGQLIKIDSGQSLL